MEQPKYEFNRPVLLIIVTGAVLLGGCELEGGWPWFRNMYDSPGPRPQEDALNLPDQTLPIEGGELTDFPEIEGSLRNPEESDPTAGAAEKGRDLYNQFCQVCHGRDAKGREMTDDFFTPDLTEEDYIDYSDEDLYFLLVDGGLSMPSYREELTFRERWLVINHLRSLQKTYGQ